jgi:predicted  nucleic acid-binding Zn-ribbon protein
MSVLQPTVGELVDRRTILALKIHHGHKAGVDTAAWLAEQAEIEKHLSSRTAQFTAEQRQLLSRLSGTLQSINASLWAAEDEVRALAESEVAPLAALAKRIARLNDQRAQAVRELNRLAGENSAGNEKIYGAAKPPAP